VTLVDAHCTAADRNVLDWESSRTVIGICAINHSTHNKSHGLRRMDLTIWLSTAKDRDVEEDKQAPSALHSRCCWLAAVSDTNLAPGADNDDSCVLKEQRVTLGT